MYNQTGHKLRSMQSTADTALGYMKAWGNKAKQYALNLTDIEIKTEQATNNDPWGPHGTAMGGMTCLCQLNNAIGLYVYAKQLG